MSTRSLQSIDVGSLPSLAFGSRTPLWWGTLGLITIEAVTFAVFIVTYFYAEVVSDVWPPGGINIPHLLLPTVSMAILLVSCVPAYLSTRAARQGNLRRTRIMLLANVILAAIGFAIRIVELPGSLPPFLLVAGLQARGPDGIRRHGFLHVHDRCLYRRAGRPHHLFAHGFVPGVPPYDGGLGTDAARRSAAPGG